MPTLFSITEVADKIGCRPRDISDLFYQRKLDAKRCPLKAGRRLIASDYVPTIALAVANRVRRVQR